MGAMGLGLGLAFGRSGGVGEVAPSVTPKTVAAGGTWNGTSGTGYGGATPVPTSATRTNGYGSIQLIDPDGTIIGGDTPAGRYIGVHALIGDGAGGFGTGDVICHIEGNTYTVPLTYREWTSNLDGTTTVGAWAHWVKLDPAVWTVNGWANVYWQYVPTSGTLETKVIGPFIHGRQTNLVGLALTVDPDLATSAPRYQTFEEAKDAMRVAGAVNGEITLMKTADYDTTVGAPGTPVENFPYNGLDKGFCTVKCAPGVTATFRHVGTPAAMSTRFSGLKFTGPRMKIDLSTFPTFTQGAVGTIRSMWFDGVELWNPNGRNNLFAQNSTQQLATTAYFSECWLHDNMWGLVTAAQLIRNCQVNTITGDFMQGPPNVYGFTAYDQDSAYFTQYRNALQLQYSGAGTGTVAKTGTNGSTTGTLVLVLNGVTTTILLNAFSKTVADVVAEINAVGGMTATTQTDHAILPSLYLCYEPSGYQSFTAVDIKTAPIILDTYGDIHGDLLQDPTDGALIQNVKAWDIQEAQLLFLKDKTFQDVAVANYAACISGTHDVIGASQLYNTQSNVNIWHASIIDQSFLLVASGGYAPNTSCSIGNSVLQNISFSGTADTDLKIANNHVLSTAGLPAQATGTSNGGTNASLYTSAPTGDWSIAVSSPLLSNLVARGVPYNLYNAIRAAMTTKGAV
jgi:hypothetical protein